MFRVRIFDYNQYLSNLRMVNESIQFARGCSIPLSIADCRLPIVHCIDSNIVHKMNHCIILMATIDISRWNAYFSTYLIQPIHLLLHSMTFRIPTHAPMKASNYLNHSNRNR